MNDKAKIKTYRFKVQGAGSGYTLYVQDTNLDDAILQAKTIVGEGRTAAFTMQQPGTLDEWMGEEFRTRTAVRWKARHILTYNRKQARLKEIADAQHT